PRSRSKTRLPVGASLCARVPPPAPVPIMITSKWFCADIFFTPFRQRLVVLPRLYGGTVTKIIGYPFAAWLARSFEPRVAAPKLTPKRAHQMLTDLYLSRSASAGTS